MLLSGETTCCISAANDTILRSFAQTEYSDMLLQRCLIGKRGSLLEKSRKEEVI